MQISQKSNKAKISQPARDTRFSHRTINHLVVVEGVKAKLKSIKNKNMYTVTNIVTPLCGFADLLFSDRVQFSKTTRRKIRSAPLTTAKSPKVTKDCDKSLTKPCVYCSPKYNRRQDCVSASFPLSKLSLAKCSLKSNYVHRGDVGMIQN